MEGCGCSTQVPLSLGGGNGETSQIRGDLEEFALKGDRNSWKEGEVRVVMGFYRRLEDEKCFSTFIH